MTTKMIDHAESPLERHVARWIDAQVKDYDGLLKTRYKGVRSDIGHGCSSGIVSHLIYTRDCIRFYRRFRKEIDAMYSEAIQEYGADFKLNGWNTDDPLAREDNNQNVLAWFGFEETALNLFSKMGL